MKQLTITILLAVSGLCCSAQNISRHYVSRGDIEGVIYHTMPVKLFNNAVNGELTYDITYKSYIKDTVAMATLNFTYYAKQPSPARKVAIKSQRLDIEGQPSQLYIEPERNIWRHRYSLLLPIEQLYPLYNAENYPQFIIECDNEQIIYEVRGSAWRNYAPIGYKIFELIRLNDSK